MRSIDAVRPRWACRPRAGRARTCAGSCSPSTGGIAQCGSLSTRVESSTGTECASASRLAAAGVATSASGGAASQAAPAQLGLDGPARVGGRVAHDHRRAQEVRLRDPRAARTTGGRAARRRRSRPRRAGSGAPPGSASRPGGSPRRRGRRARRRRARARPGCWPPPARPRARAPRDGGEHVGHERLAGGVAGGEPQRRGLVAHPGEQLLDPGRVLEQRAGLLVDPAAGGGERDAARRALEQRLAGELLEALQALGERRLRDPEPHRRPAERARVGGHAQRAQLVDVGVRPAGHAGSLHGSITGSDEAPIRSHAFRLHAATEAPRLSMIGAGSP